MKSSGCFGTSLAFAKGVMDKRNKILIIENERAASETLCDYLAGFDIECVCIESAEEFANILCPEFSAAIIDINIEGEIDGLGILEQIKSSQSNIYTIVVTAKDIDDNRKRSLALGADSFFGKPFDLTRISDVLGLCAPNTSLRGKK